MFQVLNKINYDLVKLWFWVLQGSIWDKPCWDWAGRKEERKDQNGGMGENLSLSTDCEIKQGATKSCHKNSKIKHIQFKCQA